MLNHNPTIIRSGLCFYYSFHQVGVKQIDYMNSSKDNLVSGFRVSNLIDPDYASFVCSVNPIKFQTEYCSGFYVADNDPNPMFYYDPITKRNDAIFEGKHTFQNTAGITIELNLFVENASFNQMQEVTHAYFKINDYLWFFSTRESFGIYGGPTWDFSLFNGLGRSIAIAIVCEDGGNYQLYLNGIRTGSPIFSNMLLDPVGDHFGFLTESDCDDILKYMQYVRVYNRRLSAGEVLANYNALKYWVPA